MSTTGATLTRDSGGRPRIILPMPHPGQRIVMREQRRFNWLCAGRRWRKTTLFMALAVEAAIRRQRVVWGAPVYDQVFVAWEEARRAAGTVADFNASRMTATFPGGGKITYRSLDDPDNARSHTADGVIIDEAGDVESVAWHEVLRPMLMDTNGWAWCGGTPKGRNWFWEEHTAALDRPDSAAWQAPTLGVRIVPGAGLVREPHPLENPTIPLSELEDMWRTMPERSFRQEVLAEFTENAGGVFRGIDEATHDRPTTGPVSIGIDWGITNDFTVFTALQAGHVVGFDRMNEVSWELQRGRLRAFCDVFRPALVMPESNSMGGPLVERLQIEMPEYPIQPFTTTAPSKRQLIDHLALGIEQGRVTFPAIPHLVAELKAYQYSLTAHGAVRMSAPKGKHDDCVISLALAYWAQEHRGLDPQIVAFG